MAFLNHEIELTRPARYHESINGRIGRIIDAYCLHQNIEFEPLGSWILKNKWLERGAGSLHSKRGNLPNIEKKLGVSGTKPRRSLELPQSPVDQYRRQAVPQDYENLILPKS